MKKIYIVALPLLLVSHLGFSQEDNDSLRHLLSIAKDDTTRILRMAEFCHSIAYANYDTAVKYGVQALALSERINYQRGKLRAYIGLGNAYLNHGDIAKGLKLELTGLQLAEGNRFLAEKACFLQGIGWAYDLLSDYPKAIIFLKRASQINRTIKPQVGIAFIKNETEVNLGNSYLANDQPDSALLVLQRALAETESLVWRAVTLQSLGVVYTRLGDHQTALAHLHESLALDIKNKDTYSEAWAYNSLANLFKTMMLPDSCIFYARKALAISQNGNNQEGVLEASKLLAEQYEKSDVKEALYFRKVYDSANDEKYGAGKVLALQKTLLEEQQRERELEANRIAIQNQFKQYSYLTGLCIVLLIAFILYRNNRQKQKANGILEQTLSNLKSTQAQLIQSEKMASLGELTAGIAHEIQNPLNFVNNFSEVSAELISELNTEIDKGNTKDVKEIATDLKQNLEKINHHGKRAADIVKGMLQHSQSSSGKKESTNINALADEYLRLAYHGLRAKDKSFNATMKTDFDETIGNINIIPQDIGRVILNLINNAFYAVKERANNQQPTTINKEYEPWVTVSTKNLGNKIEISIKDNGNGIPQKILDKIFQPFFTTKPTGQGTGLGLSLAFDIVTKGHGGTLEVESAEGAGSEFTIALPIKTLS